MPRDRGTDDIPGTLKRSPAKAQRLYKKVHDSAVESYGEGERAHRTAFDALKHSYEKVGDHWEAKRTKGPSDAARRSTTHTAGGVDVFGHTKEELYARAKRLGVKGRSRMTKQELGEAIARTQD